MHVATYRERGITRRFRASAVAPWKLMGAQIVVGFGVAVVGALVLFAAAALLYDVGPPASPGPLAFAFVLGTLSFLALGLLLGTLLPTARAAQAVGMGAFLPNWMLSGAGPPRSIMSEPMQRVSDAMPLTHVVTALQDPWLGLGTAGVELIVLAAILVSRSRCRRVS